MTTYTERRTRSDRWNERILNIILPKVLPTKSGWRYASFKEDTEHCTDLVASDGTTLSLRVRFDYPEHYKEITFRANKASDELDKLHCNYILYIVTDGEKIVAAYVIDVGMLSVAALKSFPIIRTQTGDGFRAIPLSNIANAVVFQRICPTTKSKCSKTVIAALWKQMKK